MILVKSEGISSRTNLVYFALEHNKFNYLIDESFSNQLWICLLKCLPGVVVVCVSGDLDDNDLNHFLSVRGRSAGSWTAAGNRAYEGSYLIPSFVLFLSDWAGKRRPPLLFLYICHRNSVLHSLFFFSSRNASPSLPFPPLLVKIEESRVTTKNGWVAAVSLRKDRIIIRFWETAFLPHP